MAGDPPPELSRLNVVESLPHDEIHAVSGHPMAFVEVLFQVNRLSQAIAHVSVREVALRHHLVEDLELVVILVAEAQVVPA